MNFMLCNPRLAELLDLSLILRGGPDGVKFLKYVTQNYRAKVDREHRSQRNDQCVNIDREIKKKCSEKMLVKSKYYEL